MKKIVVLLIVSILILSGMNAQQVKNGGSGRTIDSTVMKANESDLRLEDPNYKPKGAPWCEGIDIANGRITFKQVLVDGKLANASFAFDLSIAGIAGEVTDANIKWQDFREIKIFDDKGKEEYKKIAYCVIEKDGISLLINHQPGFKKNDMGHYNILRASDGSKTFTEYEGAICILSDGTVVASTPTTLLAIGFDGIRDEKVYDKELGEGDDLIRPKIDIEKYEDMEFAHITDVSREFIYSASTRSLYNADGTVPVKLETSPCSDNPFQFFKWCEGIDLEDVGITFKNVMVDDNKSDISVTWDLSKYINGELDINNIKWQAFGEIDILNKHGKPESKKVAYFVIEKDSVSVLIYTMLKLKKQDTGGSIAIGASDGSNIFTYDNAICILDCGEIVASTPTTLIRIGQSGNPLEYNYDDVLGEGPDLIHPTINRYYQYARIEDELSMPGQYILHDWPRLRILNIDKQGTND
jgi:hypothetical protein